ncbi:MAG TPA: alpha/beta hydrolase family protein [Nocardioides sp.]|nr:alpha/beta hydrolase family protein [Nocardioides sp.]
MALLSCDFFSEALMVGTSVTVVLPQATEDQIGVSDSGADGPPPVLYLLHGLTDDHTAWHRYTSVARYAEAAGLAVVMPSAFHSFYADEVHGHAYWTFVSEELPAIVRSFFRVSDAPEDTFVAGLSMGGYGALKLALTHPDRYAAAASLSGALDVTYLAARPDLAAVFGRAFDDVVGPADDLFALLDAASSVPPLYVGCGTEDHLFEATQRFLAAATAAGVDLTIDLRPGEHEWSLWDRMIEDVIGWLPIRRDR